jgi:hypothetical protein
MGQDLLCVGPIHRGLLEEMERLKRLAKPSYFTVYDEMERALRPIYQSHLDLLQTVSALASSPLMEVARANQHFIDLAEKVRSETKLLEGYRLVHPTWLDQINPDKANLAHIQAMAKISLLDVSYRDTITERLFAGIDFDKKSQFLTPPLQVSAQLESVCANFASSYEQLATSISSLPNLVELPSYVIPGASREVFTTGRALHKICFARKSEPEDDDEVLLVSEIEQETSLCLSLLEKISPSLVKIYLGARGALKEGNEDRARHILVSLRELWSHLLRTLAPDNMVITWLPEKGDKYLHEGKPTRKARILYICRDVNHEPLSDFLFDDVRALVSLLRFFNQVHNLEPGLSDDQLNALMLRTDSWLMFILQIAEGSRR